MSRATLREHRLRSGPHLRIAAPTAVAHDSNHTAGRALSTATRAGVPEADGFLYLSRFTGHLCLALFDKAVRKLEALEVTPLVVHTDFLQALVDYEITLTTGR